MIRHFRHKGLELFYQTGNRKSIIPEQADKIARILDRLDASTGPLDMNLPGYKLHQLKGREAETWSVWVNGNWRITFRFAGEHAVLVDYRDYH